IDLAVTHATDEQIDQLASLADQFATLAQHDPPDTAALYDLEYRFHRTILDATGSALVAGMHHVLLDFFTSAQRARSPYLDDRDRESFTETAWGHRMIAQAFRRRDIEQARAAMRHHLRQDFELPLDVSPSSAQARKSDATP